MAKTLKCNRCKGKYRMYPVTVEMEDGVKVKHYSYKLYDVNKHIRFYIIQKSIGKTVEWVKDKIDFDKKGRVVCNCPRCHQLMVAV